MGRVFAAVRRDDSPHDGSSRVYAVKRLHPHLLDDPRAVQALEEETRVTSSVDHPNVLAVHEFGEDVDGPFLAMDYVEGCSLSDLGSAVRRADEDVPLQICFDVARQLAHGLHAIHEQSGGLSVVHRDVSPHNVLIDYEGRVRLADFGIAKTLGSLDDGGTSTGVLKGKIGYMSPEQLRFETPDHRADLFAVGVVLWELLAGRHLYQGSGGSDGARRILNEPPPDVGDEREDAPDAAVALLFELLAKDRAVRPADAATVAQRLEAILAELRESEGSTVALGDYTASFFEEERGRRRRTIDDALVRSQALDDAQVQFGGAATPPPFRAHERTREDDTQEERVSAPPPAGSDHERWRVKGAAIAATVDYLVAHHGAEGYASIVAVTSPEVRAALEPAVLMSNWYPGAVMVELTDAAERAFGGDAEHSLPFLMGAASADFAFGDGGPYEVFRHQGLREGIEPFLETTGEIYRLYYDVGRWVIESLAPTHARLCIRDGMVFPATVIDRIRGYVWQGLRILGARNTKVPAQRIDGDVVFEATWEV